MLCFILSLAVEEQLRSFFMKCFISYTRSDASPCSWDDLSFPVYGNVACCLGKAVQFCFSFMLDYE